MARELDPSLFPSEANSGDFSPSDFSARTGSRTASPATHLQPGGALQYPTAEVKMMQSQIESLKAALLRFESQLDHLSLGLKALTRDSEVRQARLTDQVNRIEEGLSRLTRETAERFAQVSGRLNERRVTESKTQELVERQNVLVRNFENRLAAVQKVTEDQEQALITAHAALEEARAELARFRRGVLV